MSAAIPAPKRRTLVATLVGVMLPTAFELSAQPKARQPQFIYLLHVMPRFHDPDSWGEAERTAVSQHFSRLAKAAEIGRVVLAGRSSEPLADTFGVVIFEADDAAAARRFMESDPAVAAGLMSATLHPFSVALPRRFFAE